MTEDLTVLSHVPASSLPVHARCRDPQPILRLECSDNAEKRGSGTTFPEHYGMRFRHPQGLARECILGRDGLQSLCEVMSTVPAGATEVLPRLQEGRRVCDTRHLVWDQACLGDVREAVAIVRADIEPEALLGGATTWGRDDFPLVGSLDREGADAYSSMPQRAACW